MLSKLYWRIKIIFFALRWIPNYNIGDEVLYQGKVYRLNQGVSCPLWDIVRDDECLKSIHQDNFRKIRTLKNYWGSFRSGYRFYMGYWYSIWVRKGIEPWVKRLNIWGNSRRGSL